MKMRAERGKTMNDAAADLAKDWLTLGLAGLGNSIARNQSPHFLTAVDATNVKAPF